MEKATSKSVSPFGVRSSSWGAMLVFLGAGLGSLVDRMFSGTNTGFGLVIGLLAGATASAILERKQGRGSRVGIVMGVVALGWIVALRFVERG